MKLIKLSSMLILIVSALPLSVEKSVHAQNSASLSTRESHDTNSGKQQSQAREAPAPARVFSKTAAASRPSPTPYGTGTARNSQNCLNNWLAQNVAGFLLVGVAVWASCIAISTLDQIKRQADIAKDALSKLERAWIFVVPKEPILYPPRDEHPDTLAFLSLKIAITNSGRSPAWIIGESPKGLHKVTSPLPDPPEYKNDTPHSPIVVAG